MKKLYDVIIIGGGHAGIEAASAAARLDKDVLIITLKKENNGGWNWVNIRISMNLQTFAAKRS